MPCPFQVLVKVLHYFPENCLFLFCFFGLWGFFYCYFVALLGFYSALIRANRDFQTMILFLNFRFIIKVIPLTKFCFGIILCLFKKVSCLHIMQSHCSFQWSRFYSFQKTCFKAMLVFFRLQSVLCVLVKS